MLHSEALKRSWIKLLIIKNLMEIVMHSDFYFIEQMVKEKQRQLVAEADKLRQIKSINSAKNYARKRNIDALICHIKDLGTFLFRKRERLNCGC